MAPPPEADPRGKVRVVDVWAHNQEAEQARMVDLVHSFRIVAFATSHDVPGRPLPAVPAPDTLDGRYEAVRASVDRVRFAQVGVALVGLDGALGGVWRFHVGDQLGAEDRRFLAAVGVEEPHPDARRADPRGLSLALYDCRAARAAVTRDGAEDVAYVVRHLIEAGVLPAQREEFLNSCCAMFPVLYDLKVLAEWSTVGGGAPPLAAAGRDAFGCFVAMLRETPLPADYNAFLYGLGAVCNDQLVAMKTFMLEYEERLRQVKELIAKGCPGLDPAFLDTLPIS